LILEIKNKMKIAVRINIIQKLAKKYMLKVKYIYIILN